jgi:hypothetical protein
MSGLGLRLDSLLGVTAEVAEGLGREALSPLVVATVDSLLSVLLLTARLLLPLLLGPGLTRRAGRAGSAEVSLDAASRKAS